MRGSGRATAAGGAGLIAAESSGKILKPGALNSRRVAITRDPKDNAAVRARLSSLGARLSEIALIDLVPVDDPTTVDGYLANLENYDWVVFTSPNAVRFIAARIDAIGASIEELSNRRIAVIGPGTDRAVRALGFSPSLMPNVHDSEGLLSAMKPLDPGTVFLPQSDLADELLERGLTRAGFAVTKVVAYRTVPNRTAADRMGRLLEQGRIDALVLTSPSNLQALSLEMGSKAIRAAVVCLGRRTMMACGQAGIPALEAGDTTPDAIALAVVHALDNLAKQ